MKRKVEIHADADDGDWARVPALPGCVTESDTPAEWMANLREVIEGWLETAGEEVGCEHGAELAEVEV